MNWGVGRREEGEGEGRGIRRGGGKGRGIYSEDGGCGEGGGGRDWGGT